MLSLCSLGFHCEMLAMCSIIADPVEFNACPVQAWLPLPSGSEACQRASSVQICTDGLEAMCSEMLAMCSIIVGPVQSNVGSCAGVAPTVGSPRLSLCRHGSHCEMLAMCSIIADPVEFDAGPVQAWLQLPSCLLYTSPSPRDGLLSRMPSSA